MRPNYLPIFNRVILIYIVGTIVISCSSDELNKNSLTQLSSATFWQSQEDVEYALAAVYNHLTYDRLSWISPELSTLTDEGDLGQYAVFSRGVIEPNNGEISAVYNALYRTIANCNDFLSNVDRVEMNEEDLLRYKGEVKFIRALSHFRLTQYFGDVVLAMEPLTFENGKRARSPKDEVIAAVLQDLDDAIAGLPDSQYNGHAVKGSAYALKGKVLLFQKDYQGAVDAFEKVIGTHFSIDNSFKDIFVDGFQEDSPEILFSVKFLAPNSIQAARTGMDVWYGTWFHNIPLESFADSFLSKDGLSTEESPLYDPANPFENRDPRLDATILYPGEPWAGSPFNGYGSGSGNHTPNGLGIEKFLNEERHPAPEYPTEPSEQDFVLIRYADVLLMYAEALNELSGPSEAVYNAVNEVRSRPATDMPDLKPGLSQNEMRDIIRNERKYELAFEGIRYFDLKRWGSIGDVVNNTQNHLGEYKVFLPHQMVWPIPESAINNNDLLDQNDDY